MKLLTFIQLMAHLTMQFFTVSESGLNSVYRQEKA